MVMKLILLHLAIGGMGVLRRIRVKLGLLGGYSSREFGGGGVGARLGGAGGVGRLSMVDPLLWCL